LRKYTKYEGYVYSSYHYEELCDVIVSHYDETDEKKSYSDILKARQVKANIKDIEREGVKT